MARLTMERFFQFLILLTGLSAVFMLSQSHAADDLDFVFDEQLGLYVLADSPDRHPFELIGTYRVDEVLESTKSRREKKPACRSNENDSRRNRSGKHWACGKIVTIARKGTDLLVLTSDRSGSHRPFLFDNKQCKSYGFGNQSIGGMFNTDACRAVLGATADERGTSSDSFIFTESLDPKDKVLDQTAKSWAIATSFGFPMGAGFSSAYRMEIPVNGSRDQLVIQETTAASMLLLIIPYSTEIYRSYELTRIR